MSIETHARAFALGAIVLTGCIGEPKTPFDANLANEAIEKKSLAECSTGAPLEGHVAVVFAPSGEAETAVVDGGSIAGTALAQCIERVYRSVRIAPFSGPNGTARHSFRMR